jgi:hypothetical protein
LFVQSIRSDVTCAESKAPNQPGRPPAGERKSGRNQFVKWVGWTQEEEAMRSLVGVVAATSELRAPHRGMRRPGFACKSTLIHIKIQDQGGRLGPAVVVAGGLCNLVTCCFWRKSESWLRSATRAKSFSREVESFEQRISCACAGCQVYSEIVTRI